MKTKVALWLTLLSFLFLVLAANPLDVVIDEIARPVKAAYAANGLKTRAVVINEIAWMGGKASSSDEWIELYNNTWQAIDLKGWALYEAGGEVLIEPLTGVIEAKNYYLLERTNDETVPGIPASQEPSGWGGYGLKNTGEYLILEDKAGQAIDEINAQGGWFAGDNETKQTMERKNPLLPGNQPESWQSSQLPGGTPKTKNSPGQPTEQLTESGSLSASAEGEELKGEETEEVEEKILEGSHPQRNGRGLAAIGRQAPEVLGFLTFLLLGLGVATSASLIALWSKKKWFTKKIEAGRKLS